MELREQYRATTLRILGQFQLLEFVLKNYIGIAYKLIQKRVDGAIHFGYSIEDVQNHSLERLVTIFSKLNSNDELNRQLNVLRDKRNHVAHKSLIASMGRGYDVAILEKANEDFFYLEDEVQECIVAAVEELRAIRGKLDESVA
jgi:hypothetical protein